MVALDIFPHFHVAKNCENRFGARLFCVSQPPKMHQTTLQEAAPVFKIFIAIIAIIAIIVTNMIIISSDYRFHP